MKVTKFQKLTRLEVTWNDIISDSSWHNKEEIDKARTIEVKTLGYFLQNKKGDLKLGHSITEDGDSDFTIIPWKVIIKVEVW